jgi:glycosyltransferase involved in cell wall biosynthesis
MSASTMGVSFVVPVHNGRRWLSAVIASIDHQRDGRPFEIIAVDDGSTDGSTRLLRDLQHAGVVELVPGSGRGAAAAINAGIRQARHPIICQVDQDVILADGWLAALLREFDDAEVAAVQGHYRTAPDAGFWGRVMGRDLEQRYARIRGWSVDHVCTGNTAYRACALHQIGLLDETLGYGYDNDLSYRLTHAGYRLAFRRDAVSTHRWREGAAAYFVQQFGVGYGRLDVVAKHPSRVFGDEVSNTVMMAHAPAMLIALAAWIAAGILRGDAGLLLAVAASLILSLLFAERLLAGLRSWRTSGDAAAAGFAFAHLARDVAWAWAIIAWAWHRGRGRTPLPTRSMMRAGRASAGPAPMPPTAVRAHTLLAIVPAYNEVRSLGRVVSEVRRWAPAVDILIVDDGSTDGTAELLPALGVKWLSLPQRVGVGGAVRAGLRFAAKHAYEYAVRVDGDGQHRPRDITRLLGAVVEGRADAAIGSRFLDTRRRPLTPRRAGQVALAWCLTALTRRTVTDPTSGFWLFGPRAVRLLGRHHPTGYGEPELLLLLSRNNLRVAEVPIRMRPRTAGRTSLTFPRAVLALARTLLALVIVPVRSVLADPREDVRP